MPELQRPPSPGARFRAALTHEKPLQVVGVVNAYTAILAEEQGFGALYLSGSGVAATRYAQPDIGLLSAEAIVDEASRITAVTDLPLLVDFDTGEAQPLVARRVLRQFTRAGVAGVHIEDQIIDKRCGHLPGKSVVSAAEMSERINTMIEAKPDPDFVLMARTDALAVEGLDAALARAKLYEEAGADMIFAEACRSLEDIASFAAAVTIPVLVNMTEFGVTESYPASELAAAGAALALYPLSAFRLMNAAAARGYHAIRHDGTQAHLIGEMETRRELYRRLRYDEYDPEAMQQWRASDGETESSPGRPPSSAR